MCIVASGEQLAIAWKLNRDIHMHQNQSLQRKGNVNTL